MQPDLDRLNSTSGAAPPKMPLAHRVLFWIIILDVIGLTTRVWVMVFYSMNLARAGYTIPEPDIQRFLLGYHLLVFFLACLGWLMQTVWRELGTMTLFPLAIVLGTASLHITATQFAYLLHGYGQ